MNKHHPYNNIIERKLEQLPVPAADHLWNDMHSILDEKMPQKEEKRRFIFWFLDGTGLLVLSFITIFITGYSIFFLTIKQNPSVIVKNISVPSNPVRLSEDAVAKASGERRESVTNANVLNQISESNISTATILSNIVNDHVTDNNINSSQLIKQPKKYIEENQTNEIIQSISNSRSVFENVAVNVQSIHRDFHISTDHNKELASLIKRTGLMVRNSKPKNVRNNESGFYTGVLTGVDLSSIGFHSAKAGSTKGFIVGYSFNNKWSVESGLLWDTKRVYDNGRYFNPPGYTPTNGITITAVNGKSRIYELPVNVKYTIISGKNNLFATTGLSSYLMRSENYDYKYEQNNQPGGHNYISYKNETKNWFSVANFSLGYTHKIGAYGSFRVEPYLKLPLKDIGVGKMPIMSTGLNIGFTKKIR